jgi:hypothetical protein
MFFPGSRYSNLTQYQITRNGVMIAVTRLPLPATGVPAGFFARQNTQRLDSIAAHFLADPTAFWQLCDVNDAMAPDALAAHSLVGIPAKGV